MRRSTRFLVLLLISLTSVSGQGIFTYDQQSSTDEGSFPYGAGPTIQDLLPHTGQSFIPTLPGIDFIKLNFNDKDPTDGLGATLHLNLRSGSITGPILGTTTSVTMTNGFTGVKAFFFPGTLSVTPGTTYYFDLGLDSGGPWNVIVASYNYPRGEAFADSLPWPGGDYWFREGLYVVPEPSGAALLLLPLGIWFRMRTRRQHPRKLRRCVASGLNPLRSSRLCG